MLRSRPSASVPAQLLPRSGEEKQASTIRCSNSFPSPLSGPEAQHVGYPATPIEASFVCAQYYCVTPISVSFVYVNCMCV
ncbi:unnamed protein product [Protopolystoma xenopodis]|uniref:Uncharacterized protein n=1 Tax=Protopolystoma xenopodis TaxID=117903 RepID=A0A3S5C698_9PLAT|nr:unnamed protein product [Protopolystoma xenopodis]